MNGLRNVQDLFYGDMSGLDIINPIKITHKTLNKFKENPNLYKYSYVSQDYINKVNDKKALNYTFPSTNLRFINSLDINEIYKVKSELNGLDIEDISLDPSIALLNKEIYTMDKLKYLVGTRTKKIYVNICDMKNNIICFNNKNLFPILVSFEKLGYVEVRKMLSWD